MPARTWLVLLVLVITAPSRPGAQQPPGNYDESRIPAYTLPDPLVGGSLSTTEMTDAIIAALP